MAANRPAQLIGYDLGSFDLQGSHLEQNGDADGIPQAFRSIVNGLQKAASAPVGIDGAWEGKDAYYFRARAAGDNADSQDENVIISGVAISRDRETRTCGVEGIFNNARDRSVDAGMHYLWMRKIIPQFSKTISCQEDVCSSGVRSSEVRFGGAVNAPTRRLLDTFGFKDGEGWVIPLPKLAIQGTLGTIDGWTADTPEEDMGNVAFVIQKDDTETVETRFIENGHRLGSLFSGPNEETLLDGRGRELPITTPDFAGNPTMSESFSQPVIRRQLGLVTLKRSLLTAV